MATVNTTNITTAEQLLELPDDFGPCELVRGELTMMTPAGSRHGRAEARLLSRIEAFADKQELGSVFPSDSGFLLERNQDTVRCPDVAFVCAARMPAEPIDGFFPGPPDLAVEIRSSSTRLPDVLAKISHYLETGVKVVWDVDPETQTVTIYRAAGTVETYSGDATLTEPELLPGFSIALKEIFVWQERGEDRGVLILFGAADHPLLDEIREADVNNMTPMEALARIQAWREKFGEEGVRKG